MSFVDPFGLSLFSSLSDWVSGYNGANSAAAGGFNQDYSYLDRHINDVRDNRWDVGREKLTAFEAQLGKLGLKLKDVKGDGNCLFRALGDQLDGKGEKHMDYRKKVIDYIRKNRDDFEPFLEEEDIPPSADNSKDEQGRFERYVNYLAMEGTFAGYWALIAFSRAYSVNIVIHQLNQAPWKILASDASSAPTLHVAYFGYEHYSSIRNIGGPETGPSKIKIKDEFVNDQDDGLDEISGFEHRNSSSSSLNSSSSSSRSSTIDKNSLKSEDEKRGQTMPREILI